jgi:hypothetical protein
VNAWRSLAYGHHVVARESIEALAADWRRQFTPGTRAPMEAAAQ